MLEELEDLERLLAAPEGEVEGIGDGRPDAVGKKAADAVDLEGQCGTSTRDDRSRGLPLSLSGKCQVPFHGFRSLSGLMS